MVSVGAQRRSRTTRGYQAHLPDLCHRSRKAPRIRGPFDKLRVNGLTILLTLMLSTLAHAGVRRFALIAGNDRGGVETRPLLYASGDAKRMAEVLERLGGVDPSDVRLLLNATAEDFLAALSELERQLQQAHDRGDRTAIYVYYSGHAVEGTLELGDSRLPLASLKNRLAQAPADVRIGIFDACHSGLLTRTKGVKRAPAFDIESVPKQDAKGLVILTSSAADEDSQESDQIGGSYFSHHLASGLMGDADRSGDGDVTLAEAYAYAYERTVADTAESSAGAQHPTFSFDLAGNGDYVVTELPRQEGVVLPAALPGGSYFLVRDGHVAAEVSKPDGEERRVALAPGDYRIKRRLADRLRIGELVVAPGERVAVSDSMLHDAPFSDDPVKGISRELATRIRVALVGGVQSFMGDYGRSLFPNAGLFGVEAELHHFFARNWTWGFDLGVGGNNTSLTLPDLALSYRYSELSLGTTVEREWPHETFTPFVGARVALFSARREFGDGSVPTQTYANFSPGLVGGVTWNISERWNLTARARVHALLYNVDDNRALGFLELSALVGYSL
jgi:hypothetical protein